MKKASIIGVILLVAVLLAISCAQQAAPAPAPAIAPAPAPAPATAPATTATASPKPAATSTAAPAAKPAKVYTLRTHSWLPQSHSNEQRMIWWADQVTKKTNGAVKFQHYYSATLVAQKDQAMGLKTGLFDVGLIFYPTYLELFKASDVINLPFLPTSDARVISEATNEYALTPQTKKEFDAANIKYFFTTPSGSRMTLSRKPVNSLAEIKGLRVRESSIGAAQMYAAIGMNPIPIETSEQYDALSKGTLDAASSPLASLDGWSLQDICKYLLKLPINSSGMPVVINLDTWNSLPPDIQKIMLDTASEVTDYSYQVVNKENSDILAKWKAKGVNVHEFTSEELAKFYQGATPITDKWIKDNQNNFSAKEVYNMWASIVDKYMKKYNVKAGE